MLETALIQALGALRVHTDLAWIMTTRFLESGFNEGIRIARQALYRLEQQARIVRCRFQERLGQLHAGGETRLSESHIRLAQIGWHASLANVAHQTHRRALSERTTALAAQGTQTEA